MLVFSQYEIACCGFVKVFDLAFGPFQVSCSICFYFGLCSSSVWHRLPESACMYCASFAGLAARSTMDQGSRIRVPMSYEWLILWILSFIQAAVILWQWWCKVWNLHVPTLQTSRVEEIFWKSNDCLTVSLLELYTWIWSTALLQMKHSSDIGLLQMDSGRSLMGAANKMLRSSQIWNVCIIAQKFFQYRSVFGSCLCQTDSVKLN